MTATTDPRSPLRGLVLRPGTHLLRRSADELQVGLDPRRAVVLPDLPATRSLLAALDNPAAVPSDEHDGGALDVLEAAGLLVDADLLLPLVPTGPSGHRSPAAPGRGDVSALAAYAGERAPALVAARRRAEVRIVTSGSPESSAVAERARALLVEAGFSLGPEACAGPTDDAAVRPEPGATSQPGRSATLLVCVGEPPREVTDTFMRAGRPHLVLRLTEGDAVVGPFVLPGETTCLRCIDAHHTDHDPAWPLLLTQYTSAVTRGRPDGLAEPVDVLLASLAASWAARELATWVEGSTPVTASATVRLDPRLTALETHAWPRHPACGCSWS